MNVESSSPYEANYNEQVKAARTFQSLQFLPWSSSAFLFSYWKKRTRLQKWIGFHVCFGLFVSVVGLLLKAYVSKYFLKIERRGVQARTWRTSTVVVSISGGSRKPAIWFPETARDFSWHSSFWFCCYRALVWRWRHASLPMWAKRKSLHEIQWPSSSLSVWPCCHVLFLLLLLRNRPRVFQSLNYFFPIDQDFPVFH